jgi:hypothetical protein
VGVVEVDDPGGRRWTIRRRRYWPGWRELVDPGCWDLPWVDDFGVGGLLAAIVIAIAVGILIVVLLPLMLLLGELLIVLAAIIFLGGVWVVEGSTAGPPPESRSRKVWGGRRSERVAEDFARELREIQIDSPTRE